MGTGNRASQRAVGRITGGLLCCAVACSCLTGCQGKLDSIHVVVQRQSAALARLPEEDKDWKANYKPDTPGEPDDVLASPGVLTVEQARQIALQANPDIHAARARIDQALARIGEARASYFPAFTLGHSSSRTFQTARSQNQFDVPTGQVPGTDMPTL